MSIFIFYTSYQDRYLFTDRSTMPRFAHLDPLSKHTRIGHLTKIALFSEPAMNSDNVPRTTIINILESLSVYHNIK